MNPILKEINLKKANLQFMQQKPIKNYFKIKKSQRDLQALEEAGRDILNTAITNTLSTAGEVDRNNYRTYAKQVQQLYDMYEARTEYGAELTGGIIDTLVAFIAGEGISYTADKQVEKYIQNFIEKNKLNGSRLLNMIEIGVLEGKNLLILSPELKGKDKDKYIKLRSFSYNINKYKVEHNATDKDEITKITYRPNKQDNDKTIPVDKSVFVRIGGTERDFNETPSKLHRVITQIENCSRAYYDLRKNTHVFGKYMPYWKTATAQEAKSINNDIQDRSWQIGYGYAGTGDFSLVEPSGSAGKAILDDFLLGLKCISTTTGIPIHWLAWPELMSNRATADTMLEVVRAATAKERMIWEEALHEAIKKSMVLAVDEGIAENSILNKEFKITLDFATIALLEQVSKIWIPLMDSNIVSMATTRTKIPGIDSAYEKKQIQKEKEENMKNSPFNNNTLDNTLNNIQDGNNGSDENTAVNKRAERPVPVAK